MTIWPAPRLLPCGDRAVSVELGDEVNRELNARVLALEYLLQQRRLPGVGETVPSYRALLVYYDPLVVDYETLGATLRELCERARPEVMPPARTVELPCCYEGELGFEPRRRPRSLASSPPRWSGCTRRPTTTCTSWDSARPAHMTGMPDRLDHPAPAEPDQDAARQRQYRRHPVLHLPVESPAFRSWAVPGASTTPDAPDPILLRAGDHVRSTRIDRAEYDAIAARVETGRYTPRITGAAS